MYNKTAVLKTCLYIQFKQIDITDFLSVILAQKKIDFQIFSQTAFFRIYIGSVYIFW